MKIKYLYIFLSVFTLLLASAYFLKPQFERIRQMQETERRARSNPYLSFEQALNCKCHQDLVITPFLKVVDQIKNVSTLEENQTWRLKTDQGVEINFVIETRKCAPMAFQKNDLVRVKGEISFQNNTFVLTSRRGFIEYRGVTLCKNDQP